MQEELRPILLRRMKEDVENLPEKEEVVVWVQLTHQQRAYYKALYSNQVSPSGYTAMHVRAKISKDSGLMAAISIQPVFYLSYMTELTEHLCGQRALQCGHDA